jgi:hypothetical protein
MHRSLTIGFLGLLAVAAWLTGCGRAGRGSAQSGAGATRAAETGSRTRTRRLIIYPNRNIPDVRTKVVNVRHATGHVALGAGKDSGIKVGVIFLIHRGDEYIAKTQVTTVWDSFSAGRIVERKKPIKAGDDAMTDTTPSL